MFQRDSEPDKTATDPALTVVSVLIMIFKQTLIQKHVRVSKQDKIEVSCLRVAERQFFLSLRFLNFDMDAINACLNFNKHDA